jgi:hypothetical protein
LYTGGTPQPTNFPGYSLTKSTTWHITTHIQPKEHARPAKNLDDTQMMPHYTLVSLDITNLHSNIPVKETKTMLSKVLTHNSIPPKTKKELLKWYDVFTRQNYSAHKGKVIFQQDGLAMGAPSSGLIAETFPATFGAHIPHTTDPETQNHQLLLVCRRYLTNI